MTKFEKLRLELTEKAKEKKACAGEYRRALSASNEPELLKVICDNLNWCSGHKIISYEYFKKFNQKHFIASGIMNTGEDNTGFSNAGNDNAGSHNAGNRNAGYSNAGNRNAGYSNAGSHNAGSYNAGNRNAGYSNAGSDNAGAFCLDSGFKLFDKPTKTTFEQFRESRAFSLLHSIDTTMWIGSAQMNEQEKKDHPYHITTLGYVKNIPYKEAFSNAWHNWSDENRKAFTTLENFNADTFEKITSIKV